MQFWKYEGLGNDFVIVEREQASGLDSSRAVELCDRHFGVGADGVLVVGPGRASAWRMTVHNADGTQPEMCGNGLRCVARYLRDHHGLDSKFAVETDAGVLEIEDGPLGIAVTLGAIADHGAADVEAGGERFSGRRLSLGNPHFVMFGDWSDAAFERFGPQLVEHPAWPAGANVSFATVVETDRIALRVWERGAGPTLACGTGATATAAAAWIEGRVDPSRVAVDLPGGRLYVEGDPTTLRMVGPANAVFRGVWTRG